MNWLGSDTGDMIVISGSCPAEMAPKLAEENITHDIIRDHYVFGVSIDMSDPTKFVDSCIEAAHLVDKCKQIPGGTEPELSIHID